MVYQILNGFQTIYENHPPKTRDNWLRAAWALVVNRGFTGLPYVPHTVVVADDSSPYWRAKYLEDRGFPQYKGGRKEKTVAWHMVCEAGHKYIDHENSPVTHLLFQEYEADDIISAIVRSKPPRLTIIHSVDTDLLGLITDNSEDGLVNTSVYSLIQQTNMIPPTVVWANSSRWLPRLRDFRGMQQWSEKRLKTIPEKPTDIWRHKSIYGDKADNLIAGSPIEVIDLKSPPPEYDLLQNPLYKGMINSAAHNYSPNTSIEHLRQASKWFQESGFVPPLTEFSKHPIPMY